LGNFKKAWLNSAMPSFGLRVEWLTQQAPSFQKLSDYSDLQFRPQKPAYIVNAEIFNKE
jgi:hypothetical protein